MLCYCLMKCVSQFKFNNHSDFCIPFFPLFYNYFHFSFLCITLLIIFIILSLYFILFCCCCCLRVYTPQDITKTLFIHFINSVFVQVLKEKQGKRFKLYFPSFPLSKNQSNSILCNILYIKEH